MSKAQSVLPEEIDLAAFISQEAHDLKAPFNRILGFTRILLKGMDGPLTDLQREDLTTVYENSRRAMSFVSNLIDIARLSRGERTPEWDACALGGILSKAINAAEGRASVQVHLPAGECPLHADAALLEQGIRNLLLYAAAWVKPPAEITLQAEIHPGGYLLHIQGRGERDIAAQEMELSMWGYIAGRIIALHLGEIRTARRGEEGIEFEIFLPGPEGPIGE